MRSLSQSRSLSKSYLALSIFVNSIHCQIKSSTLFVNPLFIQAVCQFSIILVCLSVFHFVRLFVCKSFTLSDYLSIFFFASLFDKFLHCQSDCQYSNWQVCHLFTIQASVLFQSVCQSSAFANLFVRLIVDFKPLHLWMFVNENCRSLFLAQVVQVWLNVFI